jgi:hypothetical protein
VNSHLRLHFDSTHLLPSLLILAIFLFLYFLPSFVAVKRKKKNVGAILALNFFLGWTFIGWVGSLVWALTKD